MTVQKELEIKFQKSIENVEEYRFEPIKGYPMLHWKGKRPFESTQYYPAQLKETHGEEVEGWHNRIYWGDNLQVMSHLLKDFRGKINLIYIDPPFDSKADYKKKIQLRGQSVTNDQNAFEEKQYADIWTNDEYLQFMYERLILMRELLADDGSIYIHCDYHKSHYIRCLLDEVFGQSNFRNEIIWKRRGGRTNSTEPKLYEAVTDTIFWYTKTENYFYEQQFTKENTDDYVKSRFIYDDNGRKYRLSPLNSPNPRPNLVYDYKGYKPHSNGWSISYEKMQEYEKAGKLYFPKDKNQRIQRKQFLDEWQGISIQNLWTDVAVINPQASERLDYPTQKPESLLNRILRTSSKPNDIIFDSFMGSGTTQAVAMKLGRRFIGADINLGAIQTTTKRLITISSDLKKINPKLDFNVNSEQFEKFYIGLQVFNVNYYDFFRNELEAKDLLLKALEVQPIINNSLYDGEKDGRMVKIMSINRIATRADLNQLITNFDLKTFERRQKENPGKPVEYLLLVCMGHEPDLKAHLQNEMKPYKLDIEVVDILRDKSKLELKRDSEAEIVKENGNVVIKQFYPMNLLQKLSFEKQNVEDWKELVESVMIDFNYDGAIFEPKLVDIPETNELVTGKYPIPEDAGTIRVKITDLLSESLEININA